VTTENTSLICDEAVASREIHVDPALPVFTGHFPNAPMIPAALLLEWMLESLPEGRREDAHWTVLHAKFTKAVEPNSTIRIHVTSKENEFSVSVTSPAGNHATAKFRRDR
jgi:3-hydroxymyristoyl/3-hydroxydecanoyl-(acyl carrier protein) dehydratase